MTGSHAIALLLFTLFLAACGKSKSGSATAEAPLEPAMLTAATLGEQVVLPTGDYLRLPKYADADPELGQRLAMQCRACHTFERGGPNLTGPSLHGFFGRPVGSLPGYAYSPALQQADFIWTPDALDAWLAQPAAFLPGNRMVYVGLDDQADRDAVIAALLRQTTAPQGTQE
jgi:cytochrome c